MLVCQLQEQGPSKLPYVSLYPISNIWEDQAVQKYIQGYKEFDLRFANPDLKKQYEGGQKGIQTCIENIIVLREQQKTKPKNADLMLKIVHWEKELEKANAHLEEIRKKIEKSTGYYGSHSLEKARKSFIKRYTEAGGGISKSRQGWKSSWLPFLFSPSAEEVVWPMNKKTDGLIFAEKIVNDYLKGTIYEGFLSKNPPTYFQFSGWASYKMDWSGVCFIKSGAVGLGDGHGFRYETKTAVHELIHYIFEGFWNGKNYHSAMNEGYTEFIAQRICRKNGNDMNPEYRQAVEAVFYLEQIAGKDAMERAFASGNTKELEQILDSKLGKGFFKKIMAFDSEKKGCEELKLYVLQAVKEAMKKGAIKGVREYEPERFAEE